MISRYKEHFSRPIFGDMELCLYETKRGNFIAGPGFSSDSSHGQMHQYI